MAHHKKKRHPGARSHCHMCKPWKDGGFSKDHPEFEKWSDHVRRQNAKRQIEGDD
jgi:hypothetical protein